MSHGNHYDKESVQAPGAKWGGLSMALFGLGAGIAAGGYFMGDKAHSNHSYLTSYMFYLSIALGGLFFVLLQHLVRAGWSVTVRRMAEAFMKNLILMALLFIPILLNVNTIFAWADDGTHGADQATSGDHNQDADHAHTDDVEHSGGQSHDLKEGRIDQAPAELKGHLTKVLIKKQSYLNADFFKIRFGIYFVIWIVLALFMWKNSVAQDEHKDAAVTVKMGKVSAGAMPFFALTLTFAVFDCVMSLEYAWFSTIFGVIYFAGGVIGIMASLIIASFLLQKRGYLKGAVTTEHYHDMGKLLFAFIIFWAYVSFSQFMLIRYPDRHKKA